MVQNIAKERIRNIQMTIDELIADTVDLPELLASAFVRRHPAMAQHSDVLSDAAYDALVNASRKYDAKRGTSFRTFATSCIAKRLAWVSSDIARRTQQQHTQQFATDADCSVTARVSTTQLPDDYYLRLTRHQIRVICLRFEGGYSFSQIARKCGCSKVNAYKIYRRGVRRLTVSMSIVT